MPGVAFPLVTCHADGTRSLKPCRSAHSASSAALRSFRPIQLCNAPPHNHISRLAPSNDALAGHGIAFLEGDRFAKEIPAGSLERVFEDWCGPFEGYYFYYPGRRQPSPAFSLLLNAARQRLSSGSRLKARRRDINNLLNLLGFFHHIPVPFPLRGENSHSSKSFLRVRFKARSRRVERQTNTRDAEKSR
ncbi:hypothetical protein [Brevundimonas diminuta]|uniref:hypothetical protein n=1 Tax=Brevundimonas diminuta TaxID=293 RepID=UPI003D9AA66A